MSRCPSALLLVCMLVAGPARADWPQFQGPHRTGVSDETGLARAWPAGGPKVLWTVRVGKGFAGPAIADGKVYLLDRVPGEKDVLRCFDLASGKEEWTLDCAAPGYTRMKPYDGSRSTPTIAAGRLYAVGQMGDVLCVDLKTRQLVWQKSMVRDLGGAVPYWGITQSPYIYKNTVLLTVQSPKVSLVALNKDNGNVVWQSEPLVGRDTYVSPSVHTLCGVDQIVITSGAKSRRGVVLKKGQTAGIDANTGKILWQYDGWQCSIPIPFATAVGEDRVFLTGEYRGGSAMIRLAKQGDAFTVTELFKTNEFESQIHQPILYKGHIYANCNGNFRHDGMTCMTLDGKILWKTGRTPNFQRGNLLMAGGLAYNLDGASGVLHLIEPNPEGYKELAKAPIFTSDAASAAAKNTPRGRGGRPRRRGPKPMMWACMALSDGKLVLRSQTEMKCLDVKNP